MQFKVNEKIFQDFPGLNIGLILVKGADNKSPHPDITSLLREAENKLKQELTGTQLTEHPYILPWREAYRKFGANPRDFRPSNETLARMVVNGREIRNINTLVDLYNYISIKYVLTLGGEDLDQIEGDLVLDYAEGNEEFIPLGESENDPPQRQEVVYKDNKGIVCRRWNWREGDRTKLTSETKNAIIIVEGLPPINKETIKQTTNELAQLIEKFCKAKVEILLLDSAKQEVELT